MLDQLGSDRLRRNYERAREAGRRIGYVEAEFITLIHIYKKREKLLKSMEFCNDIERTKDIQNRLDNQKHDMEDLFENEEDMLEFITKYPNAGAETLAKKVLLESEYDYFWI